MNPAIATFDWNAVAAAVVSRLVDGAIGGLAVALASGILLRATRRQSASARFAILFSSLLGMIAVPLCKGWSSFFPAYAASLPAPLPSRVVLPASWALWFLCLWASIVTAGLARMTIALWKVRCLRRHCVPLLPDALPVASLDALYQSGCNRSVQLCVSDRVHAPTAVGLFRPAIVLPCWCLDENEISSEELHQVVLHEFAHLHRWDDWTNLAQKLARTVFFFLAGDMVA